MHCEQPVTKLDYNALGSTIQNCNPPVQNGKFQHKVILILKRTIVQSDPFQFTGKKPHKPNFES